ncbi:unnamed protein product [Bursaphelenchus xylophilus]|uniref:(pine wood nematode) hypothetical protein n=1 Tax=Bursaphelenchus xylophilus TaxID=6326 RepID=A0A1I7RK62_BURXY|nr:unnamed protein product [Bursaphelenchus xylophilus]CAG9131477.1 unnamed protein product [Bursaphelenchus xylophilus]
MASPREVWERFFAACDLPTKVQRQYAAKFTLERIQPYMLKDLGKEELRSLGVTALGDQLAILHYIRDTNGNPSVFRQVSSNNVSSSSQATSSSQPRTRIVKQGHALTVADDIPIRNQSRVIQKRSQASPQVVSRLRSDEILREERRQRFATTQPSTSRVFVNRNFSSEVRTSRPVSYEQAPSRIHQRVSYSGDGQRSQRASNGRTQIRYVEEAAPRARVKHYRR